MFHLRRAVARSLTSQQCRIATRYTARARVTQPTLIHSISPRPFSQVTLWRADEKPSSLPEGEESATTVETGEGGGSQSQEPIEESQTQNPTAIEEDSQIREESISDPTVTDAATQSKASEIRAGDALSTVEAGKRKSAQQPPSKIIYIGNLFFEVNTSQLEAEFSGFGEIINARVVSDPNGLSKGFAFIEFAEQSAADQAIKECDQQIFKGRRMKIQYHIQRPSRRASLTSSNARETQPSRTLFIGNMSFQMSDRDLSDLFRPLKQVVDVRVAIDRRTGQPRGFAHADFTTVEAAVEAKNDLESKLIHGRPLRVGFSAPAQLARPDDVAN